jgi:hypothetical protein
MGNEGCFLGDKEAGERSSSLTFIYCRDQESVELYLMLPTFIHSVHWDKFTYASTILLIKAYEKAPMAVYHLAHI